MGYSPKMNGWKLKINCFEKGNHSKTLIFGVQIVNFQGCKSQKTNGFLWIS